MSIHVSHRGRRRGSIFALMVVALVALVGIAAFAMDVGRAILAAQVAQNVADASAIAGVSKTVNATPSVTLTRIGDTVAANNLGAAMPVTWSSSEVNLYDGGQTVAGYGTLGAYEEGVRVVTHIPVTYYFAPMLGISGTTVTRTASAVRIFGLGSPVCPMWISHETEYRYGEQQELLMADGPHCANIPGSFGFLSPLTGSNDFLMMLRGYAIPDSMIIGNYVEAGGTMYAYTGLSVGQWSKALESGSDGLARLQRAAWQPYASDTFTSYHKDNPRIMIIPLCEYLGGTGSNAQFLIRRFGAFWLEDVVTSGAKRIVGRFIQFQSPGAGGDALAENTGLWRAKLVR